MRLTQDILTFLTANGFECKTESVCGSEIICVSNKEGVKRIVLPVSITAENPEDAQRQSADLQETVRTLTEQSSCKMLLITEDRWRSQMSMMEARLLAHLEVFFPVYARNCEIRKIDKAEAAVAGDGIKLARVQKARLSLRFADVYWNEIINKGFDADKINQFFTDLKAHGISRLDEWCNIEGTYYGWVKGWNRGVYVNTPYRYQRESLM